MTFQVTLGERMEAQALYARFENRFHRVTPFFFGSLIVLMSVVLWMNPSPSGGVWWMLFVGVWLYIWIWEPYKIRRDFRRNCGGDVTPPVSYEFFAEGFIWRWNSGQQAFAWGHIKRRVEGRNVWIFVVNAKKPYFLILPKRATNSEEGRVEWAIVDAAFSRQSGAPIASPY